MLEELRNKIDVIDDEIARLYLARQSVVKEIGEEKARNRTAVADPSREKKIIARVTKSADDEQKIYLKRVFETILETSRAYQRRLVAPVSALSDNLRRVLMDGKKYFPVSSTVACQGVEGSYSSKLRVCHHLLAKKGVKLSDIKEIFSHEQAIGQCAEYLQKLPKGIKITACANTAVAAESVATSERNDVACIASRNCADLYDLGILDGNIQDNDSNYTRFICISKDLRIYAPANRISIMMTLPHESGSLNRVLNKFSTLGLNLTKLESRPLPGTDFEFMFYFDFEGQIENSDTLALVAELDLGSEQFVFLGSYYEVSQ